MMDWNRRFLLTAAGAVLILLLLSAPALAFSDVPASHPQYQAIETFSFAEVITGYPDNTFRPANAILRAQFAKMIVVLLSLPVSEADVCHFYDVERPPANLYPDNYVAVGAKYGIIKGFSSTTFKPYNSITRAQVMTLLVRMADVFYVGLLKTPPASWHGQMAGASDPAHGANIRKAEYNGLLAGVTPSSLAPYGSATRAEVARMILNLELLAARAAISPCVDPSLIDIFTFDMYRQWKGWAAGLVSAPGQDSPYFMIRRQPVAWTLVEIGTGDTADDARAFGLPERLVQYLWPGS